MKPGSMGSIEAVDYQAHLTAADRHGARAQVFSEGR
jgi:hypothetical protein